MRTKTHHRYYIELKSTPGSSNPPSTSSPEDHPDCPSQRTRVGRGDTPYAPIPTSSSPSSCLRHAQPPSSPSSQYSPPNPPGSTPGHRHNRRLNISRQHQITRMQRHHRIDQRRLRPSTSIVLLSSPARIAYFPPLQTAIIPIFWSLGVARRSFRRKVWQTSSVGPALCRVIHDEGGGGWRACQCTFPASTGMSRSAMRRQTGSPLKKSGR